MNFVLAVAVVFILLCSAEIWFRKHQVRGEFGRKFVHITVGSFVAFWPFLLSWNQIKFLSLAFLLVVGISKYLHVFQTIHSVQRPTWGELFFALAVGSVAFITHNKWIYMTALLQMSLADGLAAVIGTEYGRRHRYRVLGHPKSWLGSLTFFVVSVVLLVVYTHLSGASLGVVAIFSIAAGTTLMENFGVFGLDNLLVPIVVASALALI